MEQIYLINKDNSLIDNYVNVKPGEPYLLLPYGILHKGDRVIRKHPYVSPLLNKKSPQAPQPSMS